MWKHQVARTCRTVVGLCTAIAGLTAAQALADNIQIKATPETVPAGATTNVVIEVTVDVQVDGAAAKRDPAFTFVVNDGELKGFEVVNNASELVKIEQGSSSFIGPSRAGGKTYRHDFNVARGGAGYGIARGTVRYSLTVGESVQPGEILMGVEGSQNVMLLGRVSEGGTRFTGSGKVIVAEQTGSGPPVDPPTTPPSTSTNPGTANPSPDAKVAILTLIGLLLLGGIAGTVGRSGASPAPAVSPSPGPQPTTSASPTAPTQPAAVAPPVAVPTPAPPPKRQPPPVPAELKHDDLPQQRPNALPRRDVKTPPPVSARELPATPPIPADLPPNRPTPKITVILEVTPDRIRGDGVNRVHAKVKIVKGPPDAYVQSVGFQWFNWDPAKQAPYISNQTSNSADFQFSWYWRDIQPACEADVTVIIPSWPRKFFKAAPPRVVVQIKGASPRLRVNHSSTVIDGTGRDGIDLAPALELFGEIAGPEEHVSIRHAQANVSGQTFDHLEWRNDPQTKQRTLRWIAPFLMARPPDGGSDAELVVSGAWTAGPLWERAGRPSFERSGRALLDHLGPGECKLDDSIPIHINGCIVEQQTLTPIFLPLAGTPLKMKGRLLRCDGSGILNPLSAGALRAKGAGIQLQIEDRTQGPLPPPRNGCRIPASPPSAATPLVVSMLVAEDAHFWTPGQLSAEEQIRRDAAGIKPGQDLDAVVAIYTPQANKDPIDSAPLVYTIVVRDGLGPDVRASGTCRVSLKSLLLETGGFQFAMYEFRPQSFQVSLEKPNDDGVFVHRPYWERPLRLVWEFAVVNESGSPLAGGSQVETLADPPRHGTTYPLWVGRWRPNQKCDEHVLTEEDRAKSLVLRRRWHETGSQHGRDEEGLKPFRTLKPGSSGSSDSDWNRSPWTDRVLRMAVRVELRTAEGHLLGTSDRVMSGLRTPPDLVWGDHTFSYVLAKLRFHLQDSHGRPYVNRAFQLKLCEAAAGTLDVEREPSPGAEIGWVNSRVNERGLLEALVLPDAEVGILGFLPGPEVSPQDPWCEIEVDLGGLQPVSEPDGVRARLENFGLCPGNGRDAEQVERAVQRLQTILGATPTGRLDEKMQKQLDEIHQTGELREKGATT